MSAFLENFFVVKPSADGGNGELYQFSKDAQVFNVNREGETLVPIDIDQNGMPEFLRITDFSAVDRGYLQWSDRSRDIFLEKQSSVFPVRNAVIGVPDYDRSGLVEVSLGINESVQPMSLFGIQWDLQGQWLDIGMQALRARDTLSPDGSQSFDELVVAYPDSELGRLDAVQKRIEKARKLIAELGDQSIPLLEQTVLLGELNPFGRQTPLERLAHYGIPVVATEDRWRQDSFEYALSEVDGRVVDVHPDDEHLRGGGDIFYVRNNQGELLAVISDEVIRYLQYLFFENGQVISFEDARELWAAQLGLDFDHVVVLPKISPYVHLDQQLFFPNDGKVLLIKLPPDHADYQKWREARLRLEKFGFEVVSEIGLPENFIADGRSPLNIFVYKDEATEWRTYFIPLDPVLIYSPAYAEYRDLRDPTQHIPDQFVTDDQLMIFYDPENVWPFTQKIKEALINSGVPEEAIVFFPYNGLGHGSLHCITNVHPIEESCQSIDKLVVPPLDDIMDRILK